MLGVDVSHWNGTLDFEAIAQAEYEFAFAKATEPDNYFPGGKDELFPQHIVGAQNENMPWSGYHFWRYYGTGGPEVQIDKFLEYLFGTGRPTCKYIILDVEDKGAPKLTLETRRRLARSLVHLDKHLPVEYQPMIYTRGTWWDEYIGNDDVTLEDGTRVVFTQWPLWVAHYTYNPSIAPRLPKTGSWSDYLFYQYTDRASIPNAGDPTIDANFTRLTKDQLWAVVQPEPPTLEERVIQLEARVSALEAKVP